MTFEPRWTPAATAEVLDRLYNAIWREGIPGDRQITDQTATFTCAAGQFTARVRNTRALDRLATRPPYTFNGRPLVRPRELVDALRTLPVFENHQAGLDRLAEEVEQSADHMQLFLDESARRARLLDARRGFLRQLFERRGPTDVELESWCVTGHAVHPTTKTRTGLTPDELRRYSPEFAPTVELRMVEVQPSHLVESSWIEDSGLPPGVMAVHPWQFEHTLPRVFAREVEQGIIRPLDWTIPARPLVSFRTFSLLDTSRTPYQLKLPVAIQMTSAMRTVSAQSAQNGPRLSRLIRQVLAQEPDVAAVMHMLAEPRALHFWDPGASPTDPQALERARHLSMIMREPPPRPEGRWTVPCGLLNERNPLNGRPIVCELVESGHIGPVTFLEHYVSVNARAVLPFLLRHGISLEAHSQNTLMEFENGVPVRLLVRDLGGLRIYRPWTEGLSMELHPASVIVAQTPAELLAKTHHTWVQGHLAPVVSALADGFSIPEDTLWNTVRSVVQTTWSDAVQGLPAERVDEARRLFFRPHIEVKALTMMRIHGTSHHYDFCDVLNPL